jgi:phage-related protein
MRYTGPQKIQEQIEVERPPKKVRSALANGKIARVLFCFHEERLYALHGFIKKSQKTPPGDLSLAPKRKRMIEK